jgi:hypothetical protein
MTPDREMLEMAAKAAGYKVRWHEKWQCYVHEEPFNTDNPPTPAGQRQIWVPLSDAGDAMRLAVELRLHIESWVDGFSASALAERDGIAVYERHYDDDPERATCRAIVRAAAEIWGAMK